MDFVGKKVFIQTVTMYYTGKVVDQDKKFLELECACLITDTGRFMQAVKDAEFSEVEPFAENVFLSLGAVVSITEIKSLPTKQK
jgi:nanoRNase/pAp phosphatase (c-di-AMP/oligoRNAs hydrolase)